MKITIGKEAKIPGSFSAKEYGWEVKVEHSFRDYKHLLVFAPNNNYLVSLSSDKKGEVLLKDIRALKACLEETEKHLLDIPSETSDSGIRRFLKSLWK